MSQNETDRLSRQLLLLVFIWTALGAGPWAPTAFAAVASYTPVDELDFSAIKKVEPVNSITPTDVQAVVPTTLQPTNNPNEVTRGIMDHSLNNFLSSPAVRNTSLGKTATAVEKSMQADLALSEPAVDENGKPGIQHKLNFNLQPAQAFAQMKYSGFLDANLNYRLRNEELSLEMTRRVFESTQVVVNSATSPALGHSNRLVLRWDWF